MTQAGVYGQRLGQGLRSKQAPVLITRSLHSAELAVTEVRNDDPTPDISGSLAAEDAYLLSLKLRDYPDCECWEEGRCVTKADVRAGATYLYDLKRDPRYVIDKPFHSLFFYLPRSALNGIARQPGGPRVGELSYEPGIGHDDEVVRHVGGSLRQGLCRPDETNQLFVDHMMLALTAHVAQTYGGLKPAAEPSRGGLAPWQVKRACDRLDSDLSGKIALQLIATEHIRVALHRMDHNGVACPADADEILHRENPKLIGYRRPPPGYRRPPHDRFIGDRVRSRHE